MEKLCCTCGSSFVPRQETQRFCSRKCKGRWQYISGELSTDRQYEKISGNWRMYYSRLLHSGKRTGAHNRKALSVEDLLAIHDQQNGLCALSGVPLTCKLKRGEICYTNASIDRIEVGGPYTPSNIQLVCRHVNSCRGTMPIDVFIQVCKTVAGKQGV